MKVKELIEELQKLNPEREVRVGKEYIYNTAKIVKVDTSTVWSGSNGEYYRIDIDNITKI